MASAPPYDPSIDYAALGYSPDVPGQNVLQGMPQAQPVDPSIDYAAMGAQQPSTPPAAPSTNILQQAVAPQTQSPPMPGADRLGTVQPSQNFGQPGTYMPPAPAGPPRQRASFLDFLGKLGERINSNFGDHYGDHAYARQELARTNAITDATKLQDLAQTQTAAQQNAIPVLNGFANSLLKIKNAGGNLDVSGPVLADQLGIPQVQAQKLLALEKAQPGALQNFADATAQVAASKGGQEKFNENPTYTRDAAGNYHLIQIGNQGSTKEVTLPDGQHVVLPVTYHDQGTQYGGTDKFGAPAGTPIPKSGNPEPGTGNPDVPAKPYVPIGPKSQDEHEKFIQAQKDAQDKANAAAAADQQKQRAVQDNLKSLETGIYTLRDLGALNSASANPVGNAVNAFQASGVGQAISHVTNPNVAAARDQIKTAANGILLNMSAGRSQMFRTNAEQTRALQAINNPQSSLPVMLQALKAFKDAATPIAPAAPAGAPKVIKYDAQGKRIQ